ncbi:MAG: peptide chain release factor N(5)-glutamine methyltransferase [Myxococcota bacterium]
MTDAADNQEERPWTVARVLRWAAEDLSRHGSDSARLDAELLLALVLGCDRIRLVIDGAQPLSRTELARYRALHQRRRRGEPVAYLRGERDFYGRTFGVDARVLVPRPETEHLVEVGLDRTRRIGLGCRCLDLGTGSGCVAISLKKERPTNCVLASDVSTDALWVAQANCVRHGAVVGLYRSDLYDRLQRFAGAFDLIVSNPPYIDDPGMSELPRDVRDFEPALALTGGEDGLDLIRRLVREAPGMLAPDGVCAVEIQAGQADRVAALFREVGFVGIARTRDYGGHERIVSGRRPG